MPFTTPFAVDQSSLEKSRTEGGRGGRGGGGRKRGRTK